MILIILKLDLMACKIFYSFEIVFIIVALMQVTRFFITKANAFERIKNKFKSRVSTVIDIWTETLTFSTASAEKQNTISEVDALLIWMSRRRAWNLYLS